MIVKEKHSVIGIQAYRDAAKRLVDNLEEGDCLVIAWASPSKKDCRVSFAGSLDQIFKLLHVVASAVADEFKGPLDEMDESQNAPSTDSVN